MYAEWPAVMAAERPLDPLVMDVSPNPLSLFSVLVSTLCWPLFSLLSPPGSQARIQKKSFLPEYRDRSEGLRRNTEITGNLATLKKTHRCLSLQLCRNLNMKCTPCPTHNTPTGSCVCGPQMKGLFWKIVEH